MITNGAGLMLLSDKYLLLCMKRIIVFFRDKHMIKVHLMLVRARETYCYLDELPHRHAKIPKLTQAGFEGLYGDKLE